jgi:cell fate (sporulation/competence/biofilm development) regulator YlbF (YheA/YmcA/DUF963 family)
VDVIDKAKELGEMLAGSKQYLRFKDAEIAKLNDEEAQKLLKKYNEKRRQAAMILKRNRLNAEEISAVKQELQREFEILNQNPVIREYIDAKKEFEQLVQSINSVITFYIDGGEKGCASSKCGTCGGCS